MFGNYITKKRRGPETARTPPMLRERRLRPCLPAVPDARDHGLHILRVTRVQSDTRVGVRRGDRGQGMTGPHVGADHVQRHVRNEAPLEDQVQLVAKVPRGSLVDARWPKPGATRRETRPRSDRTGRVDLFRRPVGREARAQREGRRQRVAAAETATDETVLVVTDGDARVQAAGGVVDDVEVVDTEGPDLSPRRVVRRVRRDGLVELQAARTSIDAVRGLVTRGVNGRRLEKQRAGLPTTADIGEPRITLHGRQHTSERKAGADLHALTELIEDRRVERERAETPTGVQAHREAILDGARVVTSDAATVDRGASRDRTHRIYPRTGADTTTSLPRGTARRTDEVCIREDRTEIETLERRDLDAGHDREVVAADEGVQRTRARLLDLGVGEVGLDHRRPLVRHVDTGEVTVRQRGQLVLRFPRLGTNAEARRDRDDGDVELGVCPLDLERTLGVRVQHPTGRRTGALRERTLRTGRTGRRTAERTDGARVTGLAPRLLPLAAEG